MFGGKCPTYQKIVTILPSVIDNSTLRRYFYVNLCGQIASRIIQNLQHNFLNMGSTPPSLFEQCLKKQRIWSLLLQIIVLSTFLWHKKFKSKYLKGGFGDWGILCMWVSLPAVCDLFCVNKYTFAKICSEKFIKEDMGGGAV